MRRPVKGSGARRILERLVERATASMTKKLLAPVKIKVIKWHENKKTLRRTGSRRRKA